MRAERLKMSIFAPKKLCGGWTEYVSEIPHYAYTRPLGDTIKDKNNDEQKEHHQRNKQTKV